VLESGDDFHERRHHFSVGVNFLEARGGFDGGFSAFRTTFATFLFVFNVTRRFGALELALRARARRGFGARPRARRLFTQRRAVRFRGDARGVALCGSADGLTFGTRLFLAHVLRATNRTFGLLAVDRALRALGLLALHFTFGARTDRVADRGARGIVALPAAGRVAIRFLAFVHFGFGFSVDFNSGREGQDT